MIGCIIQARMGSSRLPGKVLKKLTDDKSNLDFLINQLSFSKLIDKIIIATTTFDEDDIIEKYCKNNNLEYFRGNSKDVLDRYYNCAKKFSVDKILRITSDCPLIDPEIIDKIISEFELDNYDYVTNTLLRTYPVGTDVEIFSFDSLEKSWKNAILPSEREHVTQFIKNRKMNFKTKNVEYEKDLSNLRWTLDRKEDLLLIKTIISKIKKEPILMDDILSLLNREPKLIKINENIPPNEGILKSLNEDKNYYKLKNGKNEKIN